MKLFPLTICLLVGTAVIAAQTAQTTANDPQQANLPPSASVQRTGVSSAPAGNPNPGAQIASPMATPAPVQAQPVDVPPVPPEVTFRDGKITLNAPNSTLSSVLSAISSKTGIAFEGADLGSDRLALSIGPATEADVLAAIFDGSRFDYVALGRPDSPAIVQKVILTTKGSVPSTQPSAVQPGNDNDDVNDNDLIGGDPAGPGQRILLLKQQLEKDHEQEMKQRELYLQQQQQQQQKQQQNSQPPQ